VNSNNDDTKKKLSKLALNPNIHILYQKFNIGLSKAYNLALKYAIQHNYNFLLIMDQDSKFINNKFWVLLEKFKTINNIVLISASSSIDRTDYVTIYDNDFYERKIIMSSGTAININNSKKIGFFDETFFIDEIDHDYSLKVYSKKYKNIASNEVFLEHSVGESYFVKFPFSFLKKSIIIHKPFRYYFIFRNGRIMISRYFFSEFNFAVKKIYFLVKLFLKIIIFYPDKLIYFKYIFKSLINKHEYN